MAVEEVSGRGVVVLFMQLITLSGGLTVHGIRRVMIESKAMESKRKKRPIQIWLW